MRDELKKLFALFTALCTLICSASACNKGEGLSPVVVDVDVPREADVTLSELMADNEDFVMSCFDDWVELRSGEDRDIALTGFCLAKEEPGSPVIRLDSYTVPANGYAVVRLGEDAPFRLSKDGDSLLLYNGNKLVDKLTFDASLGSASHTHEGTAEFPTPGFENSAAGYEAYLASLPVPALLINEVISSNDSIPAPDGSFCDMVEIFNPSSEAVALSGFWLSDKRSEPQRFRLPEADLEPGGYFVVCCSGVGEGHAPFKISSSGEKLYLSDANGVVDFMNVPGDVKKNESYGRSASGYAYMSAPTMGAPNSAGHEASLLPPTASLPTGSYDSELSIELSGEGTIYYTLDGSAPTVYSNVYSGPITVRHMACIRAFCADGGRESDETSFFYAVNEEHSFPILSVAISRDRLTGEKGVLTNVKNEYEYEAFVTMMENGTELFSAPCGFKLHGNDSKKGAKQNFQLRFRSKYGMSKLEYKLFENRDIEEFNSLVLKGGSEDFPFCNFRDELCTSLVDGVTELSVQAYRPVILFLGYEYHGIYFIRERYDEEYCAQRLGVSDESINMLKDYGEAVVAGSGKGFADLVSYCKSHDLREQEAYDYVMSRIDGTSLMDWYICRSYMGDTDLANVRMYNSEEADGKWRWCFYDLDWALWNQTTDPIGVTARNDGNHEIIRALFKNPDFKDRFLKRMAKLMGSVLNEQAICAKADEFAALLEPEIAADREKYGFTVSGWRSAIEQLKSYVKDGRRDKTYLQGVKNFFGLTDAEMRSYFGSKW